MKGCPRGSSGGISRLFTVMSIVIMDSIGLQVVVYDVKIGVVVDGCLRRLEVVEPWRSCAGGCLCVHTYSSGSTVHFHKTPPFSIPVRSFRSSLASLIDHDKPTAGYMYALRVYEQFLPFIYRVVCNCIW